MKKAVGDVVLLAFRLSCEASGTMGLSVLQLSPVQSRKLGCISLKNNYFYSAIILHEKFLYWFPGVFAALI
jgi:hypothetical protein